MTTTRPLARFLPVFRAQRSPLLQVLKTAIAVVLAWYASVLLVKSEAPVFAAIAAMLIVAPSVNQSLTRGIERTLGVIVGVGISVGLGTLFGVSGPVILLACTVALVVGWLIKGTTGTNNQIAISALLVLALGATSENYALDRILETMIGAAIGLAINALLVPPVGGDIAHERICDLGTAIAAALDGLAESLVTPTSDAELDTLMADARALRPASRRASEALDALAESLTMNPRSRRYEPELQRMRALVRDQLIPIVNRVVGMTRAVVDHYDPTLIEEPSAAAIADQLERQAHDVLLAVRVSAAEPDMAPVTAPLLTAPLLVRPPSSVNWVVIGSLMEDQRRIREILLGDDL